MQMKTIIDFIDQYLSQNGLQDIDPVEANALLAKAGILRDSKDRPGKPLRDLLRKGLLPHAFQSAGKGSHWIIPHSSKCKRSLFSNSIAPQSKNKMNTILQKQDVSAKIDINKLKAQLEKARLKYKPNKIKYLLIAEAPPNNIERFFYYENVHNHDYLFLGVAQALYPELKEQFLLSGRDSDIKKTILLKFKADGFYLLDLSELPLSLVSNDLREQLPLLSEKIGHVIDKLTNIILIKATVYDTAFFYLRDHGFSNIVDVRIPFPGQWGQKEFQAKFREALELTNYLYPNS